MGKGRKWLAVVMAALVLVSGRMTVRLIANTGNANNPVSGAIYLDGENGRDDKDGSSSNPVKTLRKAMELAGGNTDTIYVMNPIVVSTNSSKDTTGLTYSGDTVTIDGAGKYKLVRYIGFGGTDFKGSLIEVKDGAGLVLKNITLDGGYTGNDTTIAEKSLITVEKGSESKSTHIVPQNQYVTDVTYGKGGSLTLDGGTTLENNVVKLDEGDVEGSSGGAVNCGGSLVMNGNACITGCSAYNGSGVYCHQGLFVMNGGKITGNGSVIKAWKRSDGSGSSGGGVTIDKTAKMDMLGGEVSGNEAYYGGGVSLGTAKQVGNDNNDNAYVDGNPAEYQWNGNGFDDKPYSFMIENASASISGNNAAYGGGIYDNTELDRSYNTSQTWKLSFKSGTIEGNQASIDGGGIYIADGAGMSCEDGMIVADNKSGLGGGGVAALRGSVWSPLECGYGKGDIICDNYTNETKDDIYCGKDVSTDLALVALGEIPYHWAYSQNGEEVSLNEISHSGMNTRAEAKAYYTKLSLSNSNVKALAGNSQVKIIGNQAKGYGGGIAGYTYLIVGDDPEVYSGSKYGKFEVELTYDDGGYGEPLKVGLYHNGEELGYVELNAANGGYMDFDFNFLESDINYQNKNYVIAVKDKDDVEYESNFNFTDNEGTKVGDLYKLNADITLKKGHVTVKKEVAGTGASTSREFEFVIHTDDGDESFTLKAGESKDFTLPLNAQFTITEKAKSYDKVVKDADGKVVASATGDSDVSYKGTLDKAVNLTFTNTRVGEPDTVPEPATRSSVVPTQPSTEGNNATKSSVVPTQSSTEGNNNDDSNDDDDDDDRNGGEEETTGTTLTPAMTQSAPATTLPTTSVPATAPTTSEPRTRQVITPTGVYTETVPDIGNTSPDGSGAPGGDGSEDAPLTSQGDKTLTLLWVALMLASGAGLAALLLKSQKRH